MTDSDILFEFVVVIVELATFMVYLSIGAVILEVICPKLVKLVKRIAVLTKIRKLKRRIMSGIKVQSG